MTKMVALVVERGSEHGAMFKPDCSYSPYTLDVPSWCRFGVQNTDAVVEKGPTVPGLIRLVAATATAHAR